MQMQGNRQLTATAEQAWQALNDPNILKQCIPGCQSFELKSPDVYSVVAAIKVGPVSAKFTGTVTLSDIKPPHSYSLSFEVQGGVAGHGKGMSHVELVPNAEGVLLNYTVESQIGGKLAQLGQRLIDGAAKSMANDFFKRFDIALQEHTAAHPGEASTESIALANQDQAQANDLKSNALPRWLIIAAAATAAAIFYFIYQ
jgi:carbon monoxide dehydrogenase subunit G